MASIYLIPGGLGGGLLEKHHCGYQLVCVVQKLS